MVGMKSSKKKTENSQPTNFACPLRRSDSSHATHINRYSVSTAPQYFQEPCNVAMLALRFATAVSSWLQPNFGAIKLAKTSWSTRRSQRQQSKHQISSSPALHSPALLLCLAAWPFWHDISACWIHTAKPTTSTLWNCLDAHRTSVLMHIPGPLSTELI